jgi:hypothetical protein
MWRQCAGHNFLPATHVVTKHQANHCSCFWLSRCHATLLVEAGRTTSYSPPSFQRRLLQSAGGCAWYAAATPAAHTRMWATRYKGCGVDGHTMSGTCSCNARCVDMYADNNSAYSAATPWGRTCRV